MQYLAALPSLACLPHNSKLAGPNSKIDFWIIDNCNNPGCRFNATIGGQINIVDMNNVRKKYCLLPGETSFEFNYGGRRQ